MAGGSAVRRSIPQRASRLESRISDQAGDCAEGTTILGRVEALEMERRQEVLSST